MLAVIPAAGKADRFGGIYKELLPIGPDRYLLSEAVNRARSLGAERALIVTRAEKARAHIDFAERHLKGFPIRFVMQTEDDDLWGAIRLTLPYRDTSLLVLPDTLWSAATALRTAAPLVFGAFRTSEPGRFSVLRDGKIHTKDSALKGRFWAWGAVMWRPSVAEFWLERERQRGQYPHYDRAFEEAIAEFGAGGFEIDRYEDLGSWESYRRAVVMEGNV